MLSPPCHALLVWLRLDLNQETLDALYDPSASKSSLPFFLLFFCIFGFDYSIPAGSRAEFKVTSAVGCLFIELQKTADGIFSDQEMQSFSKHINNVEYLKAVLKTVPSCRLKPSSFVPADSLFSTENRCKRFENESLQFFFRFSDSLITLMPDSRRL